MKPTIYTLPLVIFCFFLPNFSNAQGPTPVAYEPEMTAFDRDVKTMVKELNGPGKTMVESKVVELAETKIHAEYIEAEASTEYLVFVYAEEGVEDMAIYIYNDAGDLLMTDMNPRNHGVTFCKFNLEEPQPVQVYIRNLSSKDDTQKYKTAIILTAKTVQ